MSDYKPFRATFTTSSRQRRPTQQEVERAGVRDEWPCDTEVGGRERLVIGSPADQRLGNDDTIADELEDRLVVQLELAILDRFRHSVRIAYEVPGESGRTEEVEFMLESEELSD